MKFFLIFLLIFFYSCTNFKPLYKKKEFLSNNFKEVAVVTDKKKMSLSIKKNLLRRLPPIKNEISYIHDNLYLHKIINEDQVSISLHIYSQTR